MNPQDPQQQYGQPSYTPQSPSQAPQPPQYGAALPPQVTTSAPVSPATSANPANPYEFILNPDAKQHHKVPMGDTVLKRVMVIVGVLVALTIVGTVVAKLLVPKDTSPGQVTIVAEEQQELVRVATYVAVHASGTELVNFAINTQMSVSTNKQAAVDYLTTRGTKLDDKVLASKQDAATDKLFTAALSSNTFDSTATQTLNTQLTTYQADLKKAYTATTGKKARALLQDSYDAAVTLAAQGAAIK